MASFFEKLKSGLRKTKQGLVDGVVYAVTGKARLDETTIEDLETALIAADLGYDLTADLIARLRERIGLREAGSSQAVVACMKEFLQERLMAFPANGRRDFFSPAQRPHVIMVVGVNGVGKTTTIAKLAKRFREHERSVLVAAADTFRAAASDQLDIWAQRAGVDIVRTQHGADPAAVAFDAVQSAKSKSTEIVIVDTAGRLHTKSNLMEEMKKISRVMGRVVAEAPHEVLLVIDATTGQNGLRQAEVFSQAVGVTGLVITKLDGTAKGGIVFSIQEKLKIPVRFIGVGEGIDDLQPFDPAEFVEALFA
ncbi:MAG: Signal recognition particle receptor FtsY [bacterium]|nr:Signal recognition particle receptor FtsY [bacterium]